MSSKMSEEHEIAVLSKEERLRNFFVPFESYIITVEKILVWERPLVSAVILVVINIIFWLANSWRLFSLIGIAGFTILAVKLTADYIWSQMDLQTDHTADSQGVEETQNKRLTQLSRDLAQQWQLMEEFIKRAALLRQTQRAKFFVYSIFILSTVAIIGVYMPGVYIVYLTVMGLLLWPGAQHHGITDWVSNCLHPVTVGMEKKLNIKRKRRSKKSDSKELTQQSPTLQTSLVSTETDSDEGLDEFMPHPLSNELRAALGGGAMMSDSGVTDQSFDMMPSMTSYIAHDSLIDHSHGHSDDDILSDDLPYFARGLGNEMPSINDALESMPAFAHNFPVDEMPSFDNTDSMPYFTKNLQHSSDNILFEPSHYRELSMSPVTDYIETLSSGLNFDDMTEALESMTSSAALSDGTKVTDDIRSYSNSTPVPVISASLSSNSPISATPELNDNTATVVKEAVIGMDASAADERREEEEEDNEGEAAGDLLDAEFEFLDSAELETLAPQP